MKLSKTLFLWLILGLIIGVIQGCSGEPAQKVETKPEVQNKMEAPEEENKNDETKEKTAVVGKVGDTLQIEGINVTVTGVKKFDGKINPYEPLKNAQAIQVDVIVENTTEETLFVSDRDFKLYDSEGFETGYALPSDEFPLSAEIPQGKKVQGKVYFDAPESEKFELQFKPMTSFSDESAVFEFKLN